MEDAFELAKRPGLPHHGWYLQQLKVPSVQLRRGVRSFERQIAKHEAWIADPTTKVGDFFSLRESHQKSLVDGWREDIERHRESIVILRGILKERGDE